MTCIYFHWMLYGNMHYAFCSITMYLYHFVYCLFIRTCLIALCNLCMSENRSVKLGSDWRASYEASWLASRLCRGGSCVLVGATCWQSSYHQSWLQDIRSSSRNEIKQQQGGLSRGHTPPRYFTHASPHYQTEARVWVYPEEPGPD